jgi:uncharacterized protein (DUF362 family)
MKKDGDGKKDNQHHQAHQGHHDVEMHDPLRTEHHQEHVEFLKDRYGMNIHKSDEAEKRFEAGDGPYFRPVDTLFKSDKDEKRIEESLDRSYELTKEKLGKRAAGISRRDFLKVIGTASVVGAGMAVAGTACLQYTPWYGALDTYKQINYDGPGSTATSKVAVVKGSSIESMVRAAIESAGGLGLIKQGELVLIKPNSVWFSDVQSIPGAATDAPVTTNPEVLRAVIRTVKERTAAGNIYVADHSAIFLSTMFVMQQQGIYDVCIQEGVNPLPMEDLEHINFTSDKFEYLNEPFIIAKQVLQMDHMINVPVLKNHNMPLIRDMAQYTCCIKAFVGIMAPSNRLFTDRLFHLYDLPNKVAELDLCRPWRMENGKNPGITMNVVDATTIMVSGGPHNSLFLEEMMVEHPNMILASSDRVACDSVAVAVLKRYGGLRGITKDYMQIPVWGQRQIVHAGHLGLGINDPNRITINFQGLSAEEQASLYSIWSAT